MLSRSAASLTMILALGVAPAAATGQARQADMVRIPAGTYRPLYASGSQTVRVASFWLDVDPVTRGEFAEFVRANPQWSTEARASGALDASGVALRRPVTHVTWNAANAYCAAQGKRLPTLDEWEYVAAASATARDATADARFVQHLVTVYANRPSELPPVERAERNAYGVRGMHDLVWEWVDDIGRRDHTHGGAEHIQHDAYCASAAVGAADPNNYPAFLRFAVRSGLSPETSLATVGFRCAGP